MHDHQASDIVWKEVLQYCFDLRQPFIWEIAVKFFFFMFFLLSTSDIILLWIGNFSVLIYRRKKRWPLIVLSMATGQWSIDRRRRSCRSKAGRILTVCTAQPTRESWLHLSDCTSVMRRDDGESQQTTPRRRRSRESRAKAGIELAYISVLLFDSSITRGEWTNSVLLLFHGT